jgi:hypothetical protein
MANRQQQADTDAEVQTRGLQLEMKDVEAKLKRLTTAYVENALELSEFKIAKSCVVEEQAGVQAKSML